MPKITKTFVDSSYHPGKYRDTELRGFGLKVTPAGNKVYFAENVCKGTRQAVTVTIGRHGPFTAETARDKAKQYLAMLAQGINPNDHRKRLKIEEQQQRVEKEAQAGISKITLESVLNDYLNTKNLKPGSAYNYRCVCQSYLKDWLSVPLIDITKDMIEKRHRDISNGGFSVNKNKKTQLKGGKGAANNTMRVVRALFTYAEFTYENSYGQPIFTSNPVKRLSQVNAWNKLPRRQTTIKEHQLNAWYKAVLSLEDKTIRDYLLFLIFTGLRKNEAACLKWSNVDLTAKTFTVDNTKNNEVHMMPLTKYLSQLISRRFNNRIGDYVFPNNDGTRHLADIRHHIQIVQEKAKFNFTLHDLRRTFVTTGHLLGYDLNMLKKLVNHKNKGDVTLGYIVVTVEDLRQPMEKISARLSKCMNIKARN